MSAPRRVKLFKNGRNQAIRIPRDLEIPGDEAILRKEGRRLIIEPAQDRSLLTVLAGLEPVEEEFSLIPDRPLDPEDF